VIFGISDFWYFSTTSGALDNCSSFNETALFLDLMTERPVIQDLFGDIYVVLYTHVGNYTFSDTNVSNLSICISGTYINVSEAIIEYSSEEFVLENYYIVNAQLLLNETTEINLYDLNSSYSTTYKFRVDNEDYTDLEEAYVYLDRYYPADDIYHTVEMAKTDSFGECLLHFEIEEPFYRYWILFNGTIVFVSDRSKVGGCEQASYNEPCTNEFSIGSTIYSNTYASLESLPNLYYNDSFNQTTGIYRFEYIDSSATFSNIRMEVDLYRSVTSGSICDVNSSGVSGILLCNLSGYSTDTYIARYFISRSSETSIPRGWNLFEILANVDYGVAGLFLATFLVLACALIGIAVHPPLGIILTIASFIGLTAMNIINAGASIVLTLVCLAIIVLFGLGGDKS